VVHAVEALFGAGEAVEGAVGLVALEAGGEEVGGVDGGRAGGVFEEGADFGVEGLGGVVVVVVVFVVEEVVVIVFSGEVVFGAFEVSFDVELGGGVEGGVGFLEALESPSEADGAVGEEEFGGGHGAEVGDEGAAEVVEGGGVFVGEEGGGGESAVAEGVLGGGAFAGGGAGAGGFLGVLAVGGEFLFGDGGGRSGGGGHGVLPFCWGDGFLVAIIGRRPPPVRS
jgi:hypothetical protein